MKGDGIYKSTDYKNHVNPIYAILFNPIAV